MKLIDAFNAMHEVEKNLIEARMAAQMSPNGTPWKSLVHLPNGHSGAGCRKSDILENSSTSPGRMFRVRNRKWAKRYHSRKIRYNRSWANVMEADGNAITKQEFEDSDWQMVELHEPESMEDLMDPEFVDDFIEKWSMEEPSYNWDDFFESTLAPFWKASRQDEFLEWVYPDQDMINA